MTHPSDMPPEVVRELYDAAMAVNYAPPKLAKLNDMLGNAAHAMRLYALSARLDAALAEAGEYLSTPTTPERKEP